jgi:hypothetical protein
MEYQIERAYKQNAGACHANSVLRAAYCFALIMLQVANACCLQAVCLETVASAALFSRAGAVLVAALRAAAWWACVVDCTALCRGTAVLPSSVQRAQRGPAVLAILLSFLRVIGVLPCKHGITDKLQAGKHFSIGGRLQRILVCSHCNILVSKMCMLPAQGRPCRRTTWVGSTGLKHWTLFAWFAWFECSFV